MLYRFDTESLEHAKAALILYALYKSRDKNSPLNGVETWERFNSFARGACLKSRTTAEFVQEFCRKAKTASLKPKFLATGDPVLIPSTGELIISDRYKDYRLGIIEDNSILPLIKKETIYLIMLVRERIQREKLEGCCDEAED